MLWWLAKAVKKFCFLWTFHPKDDPVFPRKIRGIRIAHIS